MGRPGTVSQGEDLAVRADNASQQVSRARIRKPKIVPAVTNGCREMRLQVARSDLAIKGATGDHINGRNSAVAEVKRIGQVVRVGNVVDKEVEHSIVVGAI